MNKSRDPGREERRLPPLEVVDPTHPLLGVLDNFGEEVSKRRCRDLRGTRLVEVSVIDVWPEVGSRGSQRCVDRGRIWKRKSAGIWREVLGRG